MICRKSCIIFHIKCKSLKSLRAPAYGFVGQVIGKEHSFRLFYAPAQLGFQADPPEVSHNKHINQRPQHREQTDWNNPAQFKFRRLVPVYNENNQKGSQNIHTFPNVRIISPQFKKAAQKRQYLQQHHQYDDQCASKYDFK